LFPSILERGERGSGIKATTAAPMLESKIKGMEACALPDFVSLPSASYTWQMPVYTRQRLCRTLGKSTRQKPLTAKGSLPSATSRALGKGVADSQQHSANLARGGSG